VKAFIYTDRNGNVMNWKANIWPVNRLICIILDEDITGADRQYAELTGENPVKQIHVGCAPVSLPVLSEVIAKQVSADNLTINRLKKTVKDRDYEIYGLDNPWLKRQPEYSI